ncbi:solute carrier family 22 member 6-B-like [Mizuhopecten yessoensis]|uniref:solute carrier family 22 member 6-B-like n=1 Tax=Mizuhopecten yessoensis TaxID=6573 RepID=UPI000B45E5E6|nr:solute carrier family 22 member 6-B-like [Mizuhopecten yessoensis]
MAFHIVSVVFIGFTPEHKCSVELPDVTLGEDNHSINDVINVTADTCSILLQRNVNGNLVTEETGCLYGVNYTFPKTSTFVSEWDLVCERDTIGRLSQSLVNGGMFLGALAAPLADKFGRKPVHVAFNIGLLAVTFTMAFVKNITAFLVLRFFVGTFQQFMLWYTMYICVYNVYLCIQWLCCGIQGMLITVVTFWLELFHIDSREDVGIVNGFMWSSSVNVLTLVAFLLRNYDWRILQLALSVFSVFSLVEILVANNLTYYGIVMMTPSFAVGRYLGFFLGSSVALLLTIITIHFDSDVVRIVEVVLFAVGRGAISNSFSAIYLYTPELFPTNLRNAGLGVASAAGRLSGIIAPFCVYMMEVALWLPSLLFGSLCLTFCFLIRCLPETKGRELPQKIEEIWEWYNHDHHRQAIDTNTVDHEVFTTSPLQQT